MENPSSPNGRQQLLDEQSQKRTADDREVQIVQLPYGAEDEGLSVPHQLSATQYNHIVCYQSRSRLFQGRHGRDTRLKFEVLRGKAAKGHP